MRRMPGWVNGSGAKSASKDTRAGRMGHARKEQKQYSPLIYADER
jgi:hypothetical protein